MKQWKEFEELAAQIYRELTPGAKVVHDDKIVGVESSTLRQIDVSIRFTVAGYQVLTIIQARDYDRPADINVVGEFASVIKDIRANKGILICKSGFTEGAIKLAQNLGIEICNIHDAGSRDWSLEIELPVLWIDLLPNLRFSIKVKFEEGDSIPKALREWVLSTDKGKTRIDPVGTFIRMWNERLIPRDIGKLHQLIDPRLTTLEFATFDKAEQLVWRPIEELNLAYTVSRRAWLGSFSPAECRGILNYSNGTFTVSYLPIGVIPKQRDDSWKEIENPDELAIAIPGTLITTEGWQIDPNAGDFAITEMHRLGDE